VRDFNELLLAVPLQSEIGKTNGLWSVADLKPLDYLPVINIVKEENYSSPINWP